MFSNCNSYYYLFYITRAEHTYVCNYLYQCHMVNFNKIKEGNLQTSTAYQKVTLLVFELNLALYTGHLQHRSVYDIVIVSL